MKWTALILYFLLCIAGEIPALNMYKEQEIVRKEKIVVAKTETFVSKLTNTRTFTPVPKPSQTATPTASPTATK